MFLSENTCVSLVFKSVYLSVCQLSNEKCAK